MSEKRRYNPFGRVARPRFACALASLKEKDETENKATET